MNDCERKKNPRNAGIFTLKFCYKIGTKVKRVFLPSLEMVTASL